MKLFTWIAATLTIIALIISCGRSSPDTPREAVIALFGAMERNDRAAIAHLLDLAELMKPDNQDYALQSDSPRTFSSPEQILDDLVEQGTTKVRWFSYQRIVNTTEMLAEDIANVEVTFVDKDASKGYMTKFGVHLVNGKWKIFSFSNTSTYK